MWLRCVPQPPHVATAHVADVITDDADDDTRSLLLLYALSSMC